MSPRLEYAPGTPPPDVIVASVGGSVFFPRRGHGDIDCKFVGAFIGYCREQLQDDKTIIAIIGGGEIARIRIQSAKKCNVGDQQDLDSIGISVTKANAELVGAILKANHVPVNLFSYDQGLESGKVHLGYGTDPGHTTDYPTVQAAHNAGQKVLLNISQDPGGIIKRDKRGKLLTEVPPERMLQWLSSRLPPQSQLKWNINKRVLVGTLSWDEYNGIFPEEFSPGMHVPFDPRAALLAKELGITVLMVGPDFQNIRKCLAGKEFVGTIVHP